MLEPFCIDKIKVNDVVYTIEPSLILYALTAPSGMKFVQDSPLKIEAYAESLPELKELCVESLEHSFDTYAFTPDDKLDECGKEFKQLLLELFGFKWGSL